MSEPEPEPSPSEDLVFRRGKLRKRDDPAIDMLRDALAHVEDIGRVKRTLLDLGRLYDPVTNGPILDLVARRSIIESLEEGRTGAARQALESHLRRYATRPEPPASRDASRP